MKKSTKNSLIGFSILAVLLIASYIFLSSIDTIEGMRSYTKNSLQSINMGVFEKKIRSSKEIMKYDSLYDFKIKEVYLENYWTCGPRCKTAKEISAIGLQSIIIILEKKDGIESLQEKYFINTKNQEIRFSKKGNVLTADVPMPTIDNNKQLDFFIYKGKFKENKTIIDSISFYF